MPDPKHLAPGARRTGRERAFVVLGAALSILLTVSALVLGYLNWRFGQITRFGEVAIDIAPASGEPRNYLLVGSDTRAGLDPDDPNNGGFFDPEGLVGTNDPQRTDTIMILRVDPDDAQASLLSLPRDLWVTMADRGDRNRINAAFTRGRDVLVDTIRTNFGIPIHHYVEVDFVGFQGLVSTIDGVPLYFPEPVRDRQTGLDIRSPGCVTLDASQALAFVRSRHLEIKDVETGRWHTDQSSDLGRISRQQEFLRRSIRRAISRGISNPVTLNDLVTVGVKNVGLDPSLSIRDILSLGRRFADFDPDSLATYSLPTWPFRTAAGAEVLGLVDREAEPILNLFRGLEPGEVTPALVQVQVLNGTGETGFAGDITAALDRVGFTTDSPGDTIDLFQESALYYAPGSEEAVRRVARHLSVPVSFLVDSELGENEVVLVAGFDFTTVHDQPSPEIPTLPTTTTSSTTATTTGSGGQVTGSTTTSSSTTSTTAPIGYVPDADDLAAAACG